MIINVLLSFFFSLFRGWKRLLDRAALLVRSYLFVIFIYSLCTFFFTLRFDIYYV